MSGYAPFRSRHPAANCKQVNVHELLKAQILSENSDTPYRWGDPVDMPQNMQPSMQQGTSASMNNQIVFPTKMTTTSDHGFEDYELYFDSLYRDNSADIDAGTIRWPIAQLNNNITLSNIISITFGQFYVPNIIVPTGKPSYFYFGRIMLEIMSVSSTQSVKGPNNQNFHIEFDVSQITGQAVLMTPIKKSIFFRKPINYIDNFQIRFLTPNTAFQQSNALKTILFPNETVPVVMKLTGGFGYNPIRFSITGNTTGILGNIGAFTAPGVAVFFKDFVSNDSAINDDINSTYGQFVTTVLNATDFEIAGIDATTVTSDYTAYMYIPKNRIAMPVRFTSSRDSITNNIIVSHD